MALALDNEFSGFAVAPAHYNDFADRKHACPWWLIYHLRRFRWHRKYPGIVTPYRLHAVTLVAQLRTTLTVIDVFDQDRPCFDFSTFLGLVVLWLSVTVPPMERLQALRE
ncbi:UNVERIFIED_ORG: hypothetical protein BDU10_7482 [Burkholderia sp. CF145]